MSALVEKNSFELLKATLNALPDGVLLVDERRTVIYFNDTFTKIWRIPSSILQRGSSKEMVLFVRDQVEDADAFFSQVELLYGSREPSRDELILKDGRTLIRRSVYFENAHLDNARIWIFSDISDIKNLEKDPLTQLFNRKKFEDEFSKIVTNHDQKLKKVVALIDIDNFKKYNDTYGHVAGDDVIRQVGEVIRKFLRRSDDRGYRVGGEEFFMICSGRTQQGLLVHIEALRQKILDLTITHCENANHGVVTVSIGVTAITETLNARELYDKVDKALYRSKEEGRNRVTIV